jgi:hypothetical protein
VAHQLILLELVQLAVVEVQRVLLLAREHHEGDAAKVLGRQHLHVRLEQRHKVVAELLVCLSGVEPLEGQVSHVRAGPAIGAVVQTHLAGVEAL